MIKKFSIRKDLNIQLIFLYLLFVVPVVLAVLVFEGFSVDRLEADSKAADLALARAIAQETDINLRSALQAVRNLGEYPEVKRANILGMDRLFQMVIDSRPDIGLVFRLDSRGSMLYHYPHELESNLGEDYSSWDYYQRALLTTQAILSKGRISRTNGRPVATAVMPLWDEKATFLGLVATNINLESLSQTLEKIAAEYAETEQFQVLIVDATGQIIAHPDSSQLLTNILSSQPEVTEAVLLGRSGNHIGDDQSGEERLFSYVPVSRVGWGVIVSRPTANAYATPYAFRRGVMATIAVFLGIGLFFWLALARQVIRPLEVLASYSQTIGTDQEITLDQRSALEFLSKRTDQVGHLTSSLIRMEEGIESRLKELSTLLRTSAAVVSTLDSHVVLNRILEQVEQLLNVQMSAIVAYDKSKEIFKAQASRGLSSSYVEEIAIDPDESYSVTLQALRFGRPFQVSDTENDIPFKTHRKRALREGYRSIIAIPLITQHTPPSALLIFRPDPHVFNEREITLLSSFANHAAMAIENAALYTRSDVRLQEQTRRLEALIQSLRDGLILEDLNGKVIYANRRTSDLCNITPDNLSGTNVDDLIERMLEKTIDPDKAKQEIDKALSHQEDRVAEINIIHKGQPACLRLRAFDVTDPQGLPIGRGLIIIDITTDRELNDMKSSLISTASHELRTPLASIKGYATTLLAEDVEWDLQSQREFLKIISDETDHLSALVSDLLDLSKIESGSLTVKRSECDFHELINRAALRSYPQPGDRLKLDIDNDIHWINVDPQRIEAVLRNLIENATKYAGDSSPVLIRAYKDNNDLIVKVEDEGPGIPVEHSQRIFDSFYRLDRGLGPRAKGSGLGLSICQGFVDAHGGEIWLETRKIGACFAFSLPLDTKQGEFIVSD
jgi:PAS domain S-box-containing protein